MFETYLSDAPIDTLSKLWTDDYRILQPIWDLRIGYEKYLSSPVFPIVLSVLYYFFSLLPWTIIDLYGHDWKWVRKYKIQPDKTVTWPLIKKAMILTAWNHVLYILPMAVAQWVWASPTFLPDKAPTIFEFLCHQIGSLIIFDFEYWLWHWSHHKVRFLYRHVHALHHEYHSPNSWVTQYLHPWELISTGLFTTTSPWIFNAHPLTSWSFQNFAISVSVDAHIGYDIPFLPHRWCKFWGGSIKHDMHHQKPLTNFEPFFNWWDKLFGHECPGQLAGGYKPKSLLNWEKKRKEQQRKRLASKGYFMNNDKEAATLPPTPLQE